MTSNFEEWIEDGYGQRMCPRSSRAYPLLLYYIHHAVKKINAANSWEFRLIDYFHDYVTIGE